MKQFRQKDFTIKEGYYTGPKDSEPASLLQTTGAGALAGAIIGGIIGKVDKDSTPTKGAFKGGIIGAVGGLFFKFILNYLHNPMTRVKYQEIDKNIRREFGIYRAAGITVGDKISKRADLDERFAFNDRDVASYKLNFCIQDNQVVMYTYNMTDQELDETSDILDYYCGKYYGMEYTSSVINERLNSYSVPIIFTNHRVISDYIIELSDALLTKINLLDNKAVVSPAQKTYSVKPLSKVELLKVLGKSFIGPVKPFLNGGGSLGETISNVFMNTIVNSFDQIKHNDLINSGIPAPRCDFNNSYLEDTLKKLHYIEGFNYTISDKTAKYNISMVSGLFLLTAPKDTEDTKNLDKYFYKPCQGIIKRTESDKVILYTYSIQSRNEFEMLLKKLMSTKITFNIFEQ